MFDPDWVCGRWLNNYYNLLTDLCEFENDDFEQMYGTDLDWYCWETQFGKSNTTITYNAGDKGLIINVNTPEKLYEFIVAKQGK